MAAGTPTSLPHTSCQSQNLTRLCDTPQQGFPEGFWHIFQPIFPSGAHDPTQPSHFKKSSLFFPAKRKVQKLFPAKKIVGGGGAEISQRISKSQESIVWYHLIFGWSPPPLQTPGFLALSTHDLRYLEDHQKQSPVGHAWSLTFPGYAFISEVTHSQHSRRLMALMNPLLNLQ